MNKLPPISQKIRKIYASGAIALLLFYSIVFNIALLFSEDSANIERLKALGPFHFERFQQGQQGIIEVDPLLTIYDSYHLLPARVKPRISPDWLGETSFFYEDEVELNVFAARYQTAAGQKTFYAIESIGAVDDVDDVKIAMLEASIFLAGLLIVLIIAGFILHTIKQVTQPFIALSHQLDSDLSSDCIQLKLDGTTTLESQLTLDAVNKYRARIHQSIIREKNFTRYVSHELRTPMTVIQGCVSILRKEDLAVVQNQCSRINLALSDMGQLIKTFLLLARNSELEEASIEINETLLQQTLAPLQDAAIANQVELQIELLQDFQLHAEPLLLAVLIQNIVSNSVSCSENGRVSLFLSRDKLEVIDNGVGLDAKPRGYEGFGIGLQIVEDICRRYQWRFALKNNQTQGCTASVHFNPGNP